MTFIDKLRRGLGIVLIVVGLCGLGNIDRANALEIPAKLQSDLVLYKSLIEAFKIIHDEDLDETVLEGLDQRRRGVEDLIGLERFDPAEKTLERALRATTEAIGPEEAPLRTSEMKVYDNDFLSAKALMETYRVTAVKELSEEEIQLNAEPLEGLLAASRYLHENKRFKGARKILNEVMDEAAKLAEFAAGDSLFRSSVEFASREDVYYFQVDKNDSYIILLKAELDKDPYIQESAKELISSLRQKAWDMRMQSQEEFDAGKVEEAIISVAESSRALFRCIRLSGRFLMED